VDNCGKWADEMRSLREESVNSTYFILVNITKNTLDSP
jgi:hypothetical protein